MDDQKETAAPGHGHGGGSIGNLSVPKDTPKTPNFQIIDAALAEIDAARKAARTAGTEAQRHHYRRTADGLAIHLADVVLKCRFPGAAGVPPMSFLREETERRRKIETAETVASIYDAAMWGAFKAPDYPTWKRWEHFAHEASRARIQAEEIRIGYRG
ncbi:MAG: hypothetical protein RIB59_14080 [Rhodospirillales bacterium]